MKYISGLCIVLSLVVFSCSDSESTGNKSSEKKTSSKKSDRDLSITKQNSYSDLFLDSNKVEAFIKQQKMDDDAAEELRRFYNKRNFQYAWFSNDGLTEQALAFRTLYDYKKDSGVNRKSLDNRLDDIMTDTTNFSVSADVTKTELLLSWRFINYLNESYKSNSVKDKALVQLVPSKKQEILKLAERILNGDEYNFSERSDAYKPLKGQLKKYVEIEKQGGWVTIPVKKKALKKGSNDTAVALLKRRLSIAGLLEGKDTAKQFTEELESAVKTVQQSFGQKADGIVGPSLIRELNVPAIDRIQQIIVNLERMRWMPEDPSGRLIVVNIPEFKLHVRDRQEKAFDMDVVVGKEGNSTIMFFGQLNQIVFSPYWNLPRSIVRNEVMPGMEANRDYLAEHNMEITGEENGLPVVRQLPGETNALGKVKFLFPNTFNIYFHDTPEKELFKKSKRAYSHGCIRLADPEKMANYLLEEDINWSPEKIDSAMNSGKEKYVRVKEPVPVLIHYYTAWVNEEGVLQFRGDIYKHDETLARKMFLDARVPEKARKEILASK